MLVLLKDMLAGDKFSLQCSDFQVDIPLDIILSIAEEQAENKELAKKKSAFFKQKVPFYLYVTVGIIR
jgi:hypothetical protein